jgi:hypothetical protein
LKKYKKQIREDRKGWDILDVESGSVVATFYDGELATAFMVYLSVQV